MAITSGDGYIASSKQVIPYTKTASVTSIATTRFSVFGAAGNPGAGTVANTTATTGEVPTSATAGYPTINAFISGNTGYLTRVQYSSSVTGRLELWDRLFGINVPLTALGTTTLATQASYASRLPGTVYAGLRIFLEITTAVSATATTVTVTYTNQAGTTAKSTGATTLTSFTANRIVELPLAVGDTGVQKIETVVVGGIVATGSSAVNVVVARPLWTNRVPLANGGGSDGLDRVGMPIVYSASALWLTCVPDALTTGVPDLNFEIANG